MNYCKNCNKTYPDNQIFCSECGSRLEPMENTSNSTTNQVPSQNGSVPNKANESESGNILQRHGGLIYGISSIIVSWWISSLVGLILGVFGAGLSLNEKSQSLRILGIICGIAGVLLGIYGLFM